MVAALLVVVEAETEIKTGRTRWNEKIMESWFRTEKKKFDHEKLQKSGWNVKVTD